MIDLVYELRELRDGEVSAAARIRQHFVELLILDKNPATWGAKFEGIAAAVDELAGNAVEPRDVERYIRACMSRKVAEHYTEIGEELPIPKSTKSKRKKNGQPPPEAPRREPAYIDDGKGRCNGDDDYLDTGGKRRPESPDPDLTNVFDALDMSDEEESVIDLAQAGYRESGIASRLRIPESQVRRILNQLQERAKHLGY